MTISSGVTAAAADGWAGCVAAGAKDVAADGTEAEAAAGGPVAAAAAVVVAAAVAAAAAEDAAQ